MKSETQYEIARLPVETTLAAGRIASWPIEVAKTVTTNLVDTAFKAIGANTEDDVTTTRQMPEEGTSVYDMARYNMDLSAMIYYYTELRAEIKKLIEDFCEKKNMTCADIRTLRDAFDLVNTRQGALSIDADKPEESPRSNEGSIQAARMYQEAVNRLKVLCKKYGLAEHDQEILKGYFEIVQKPKTMESVYSDLILFDKHVDPQFRFALGGSAQNRQNVKNMISEKDDIFLHYIDDEFVTSSLDVEGLIGGIFSEMVWAIVVNKTFEKITVVFRGSIVVQDFIVDLQVNMKDCVLPGYVSDENTEKGKHYGRVHEGFYRYLCEKTRKDHHGRNWSKMEEIIDMLKKLLAKDEYKNYDIEVTGHSLGGSLSTLFAVRCAVEETFGDKMITNVSIASPFVGDEEFCKNFQELERKRKIRHLRVSNYQDVIPLIPACTYPSLDGIALYKHCGMNIRLYDRGGLTPGYRRFYPKEGDLVNDVRNAAHNNIPLGLSVMVITNHLLPKYDARLEDKETAEELKKLSLESLYNDKSITGWEYYKKE